MKAHDLANKLLKMSNVDVVLQENGDAFYKVNEVKLKNCNRMSGDISYFFEREPNFDYLQIGVEIVDVILIK